MNTTAKLLTTVAVPAMVALAVAMGQMQGNLGSASLNVKEHTQQNPCDLIPLQLACKPSGFDLVGYCGAQCLDPAVKGRRCVIDVVAFSDVIAPDAIDVEAWWVLRSLTDGRRYYVWRGHFGLGLGANRQRYELCSECDAVIELLGMRFPYGTRGQRVEARLVTNDCINCRNPTPTPQPSSQLIPSSCTMPLYLPIVDCGTGDVTATRSVP